VTATSAWERFWFAEIPPHCYALLRILFGMLAVVSLLQERELAAFWDVDGLVPGMQDGIGVKASLFAYGLGHVAGRALFFVSLASYGCMALGLWSTMSVGLSFLALTAQWYWNRLPLSGAHSAMQAIVLCLVWADCGSVWSVDAWLARRRRANAILPVIGYSIAPLRLIRLQVALVYLSSGLWKLFNDQWRDGSAVHYVLSNNVYQRFRYQVPPALDWLTTLLTYGVLFWEISFALMVMYRSTRRIAILVGVMMHLGMLAAIEIGPFGWVMLASYISFLEPQRVPSLPATFRRLFVWHSRSDSIEAQS
jgi:Vitamin K-dependent gamma-carboxylase